ncbi:hypothetical protein RRG12_16460, partial [Nostoc sp. CALU 546]
MHKFVRFFEGGRGQGAGGRRQEAGGRRQEAGGRRQEVFSLIGFKPLLKKSHKTRIFVLQVA